MSCVGLNRGSCLPGSQPSAQLPAPASTGTPCVMAPHRCPAPGESLARGADLRHGHCLCPASSHTAPLALRKVAWHLWEKITGVRWLEKSGFRRSSVRAPERAVQVEKGQILCICLRCKELIQKALFPRRRVKAPCRSVSSFLRFLSGALQQECGLQLLMRHRLWDSGWSSGARWKHVKEWVQMQVTEQSG